MFPGLIDNHELVAAGATSFAEGSRPGRGHSRPWCGLIIHITDGDAQPSLELEVAGLRPDSLNLRAKSKIQSFGQSRVEKAAQVSPSLSAKSLQRREPRARFAFDRANSPFSWCGC